ncbi:MAG TPA: twin-arginine translocase TatA/TatE family subunit [Actinocrinis sp.]|uniref:twin-arginine translocase TatA/TatE family subunit n=1 Tax=Actinocrinis sp. TaxID=1920516 RepID=UPI002D6A6EEF|nr:twin-arginine translocase TatA/TatE family subunit [Actinocrinis sp.]HZU58306.1 twin-arginine translocase TatA/TatE family subunit [Actinocrinis sp.]
MAIRSALPGDLPLKGRVTMLLRAEGLFLLIAIGLILFGWKRLPGAMRDLGKTRRILKSEAQALRDDVPPPQKRTIVADPAEVVDRTPGSPRQ